MEYHMKQVVKKRVPKPKKTYKSKSAPRRPAVRRKLPGTSKLEVRFAENFLKPLGVNFKCQYEVKEIGRWYDFYLPDHNLIIEIDGSY